MKVKLAELAAIVARGDGQQFFLSGCVHSGTHGAGDCGMEGAKGSCEAEGTKWVYFDGDWESMETGCGFQGGDWTDY